MYPNSGALERMEDLQYAYAKKKNMEYRMMMERPGLHLHL
jgi:hypothetical protein